MPGVVGDPTTEAELLGLSDSILKQLCTKHAVDHRGRKVDRQQRLKPRCFLEPPLPPPPHQQQQHPPQPPRRPQP